MMIDVRVGFYIGHITREEVFLVDTDRESLFSSLRQRFPNGEQNGVSYTVHIGNYGGFTVTVMERLPISTKDFMNYQLTSSL